MGLNKRLISSEAAAAVVPTNTDNFDVVTYAGNNGTNPITSLDFQPDLVWIKNRDNANDHFLTDSVRGAGKYVQSNNTNAEDTTSRFNSFDSNGFTVSTDTALLNNTAYDYVAWCFKGGGSAVSNTDGSITSTVSANQDAGFSIVKYTGNGGTTQSIGHGLSSAPEMVIFKRTDAAPNWFVFEKSGASTRRFEGLNTTNASTSDTFFTPSSSTITWSGTTADFNGSGREYIMYCFHSVNGYQKVGSYTGGSSNNTITTGFQPRFLLLKRTDSTGSGRNWSILDSVRTPSDPREDYLLANTSDAEATNTSYDIEFDSDGFNITSTSSPYNQSGGTYIYLAIA